MFDARLTILWGMLLAAGGVAHADGGRSVAVYQGSVRALAFGEQVECVGPVLQTRLTYLAMPGVCDDLGNRPCAGRLVAELERCASGGLPLAAGTLAGGYSRSPVRFCFEALPPVAGDSVVCLPHNRVASGVWTGAGRAATSESSLQATALLSVDRVRFFEIDGQRAVLRRGPQPQHFTQQRGEPGPASCAAVAPGCGVMGVGIP